MSRRISFALTKAQFLDGSKDVTRRLGWWSEPDDLPRVRVGEILVAVEKAMGLQLGERQVVLGELVVVSVRREPLEAITDDDVRREGFPGMTRADFIGMFCKHMGCKPDRMVTRIEFRRLP